MYSTCLFCHARLGTNEALESFQVGRRLAYDAEKGRLWVVCTRCHRWNLTPLEERWEAIEQAERLYASARRKVATDHIGLAQVHGVALVRVGRAPRREFAAWRYGRTLMRRRVAHMARVLPSAAVALVGGGVTWGVAMYSDYYFSAIGGGVVGMIGAGMLANWIGGATGVVARRAERALLGDATTPVARVRGEDNATLLVRRGHLAESAFVTGPEGFGISLRHNGGRVELHGDLARRAAAALLPATNRAGASPAAVRDAVDSIEVRGGANGYIAKTTRWLPKSTRGMSSAPTVWMPESRIPDSGLFAPSDVQRLALEMALHEEAEREAMAGELAPLERAWRDAEEIAAIADDLLLPEPTRGELTRLRATREERSPQA